MKSFFRVKSVHLRGDPSNFRSSNHISRYNFILYGQSWENADHLQKTPEIVWLDSCKILASIVITIFAFLIAMITMFRQKSRIELAAAYKIVEDSELKFRTNL